MAFMFAPGIPIMMPLAFIYAFLNDLFLRSQLAYQHRLPFKFENSKNQQFLKFCCFLPVLYSSIGFWMYSNRQIFDNVIAQYNGFQDHKHTLIYSLKTFTPGTPLLILFVISVLNFLIQVVFGLKYHKLFGSLEPLNQKI